MAPSYTQVSVFPEGRDALRRFQAVAGGQLVAKLSMTDAMRLACALATRHLDDLAEAAHELGITEKGEDQ